LQFKWVQLDGPIAHIDDDTKQLANAGGVRGPATLRFRLTVTGADGRSDSDEVVFTVAPKQGAAAMSSAGARRASLRCPARC
jgi:hypothetical protein